jgi:hypothetical protein
VEDPYDNFYKGVRTLLKKNYIVDDAADFFINSYKSKGKSQPSQYSVYGYINECQYGIINYCNNLEMLTPEEYQEIYKGRGSLPDDNHADIMKGIDLYRQYLCSKSVCYSAYKKGLLTRSDINSCERMLDYKYHNVSSTALVGEYRYMLHTQHLTSVVGKMSISELLSTFDDDDLVSLISVIAKPSEFCQRLGDLLILRHSEGQNIITGETVNWSTRLSDAFFSGLDRIKYMCRSFWNFLKNNYLVIGLISAGIVVVIKGAYKIFRLINGSSEPSISAPHSMDTARNVSKSRNLKFIKLHKAFVKPMNVPHGLVVKDLVFDVLPKISYKEFGAQTNVNSILSNVFNKYYFNMFITFDFGKGPVIRRLGHTWNLRGQVFACPFHFVMLMDTQRRRSDYIGGTVCISNPLKTNCYKVSIEDILNSMEFSESTTNNDLASFTLRQSQTSSLGLINHLLTEKDIDLLKKNSSNRINIVGSELMTNDKDISTLVLRTVKTDGQFQGINIFNASWDDDPYGVYRVHRSIIYDHKFNPGDCGSLISIDSNQFQNRIIMGMHIGGSDICNYGNILSYETAEFLCMYQFPKPSFNSEEKPNFVYDTVPVPHGSFLSELAFHDSHRLDPNSKSEIKKSLLYNKLPEPYSNTDKRPVNLNPHYDENDELVYPLDKAILSYGFAPEAVDYSTVSRASSSYGQLIREATVKYKNRVTWTLKEALHAKDNVKGIPSSTSSGFPMNLKNEIDYKKLYLNSFNAGDLGRASDYFGIIEIKIDEYLTMYRNNVRPFFVYYDFLKDEVRTIGKNARMISGSPFYYFLLVRMYFGAFVDAFVGSNINVGSAIGVNPFSEEWDIIARKLKSRNVVGKETLVGAGDFTQYDGHEQPFSLNEVLNIINDWYGNSDEEANKIRTHLWAEITNSRHHFKNSVVPWYSSMPSGNPLTAIINTMNNNIVFRCAWILLDNPIDAFNKHVYFIALGDDNLYSVSLDYHLTFNELLLPDVMASLGQLYTTELKGEAIEPFRKLTDVEFLKRKFLYSREAARYVAPLRIDSIVNMINWTKKNKNKTDRKNSSQITVDNISTSLREFSLHGKKTYDYWYNVLIPLKEEYYPNYKFEGVVYNDHLMALTDTLSSDHQWAM